MYTSQKVSEHMLWKTQGYLCISQKTILSEIKIFKNINERGKGWVIWNSDIVKFLSDSSPTSQDFDNLHNHLWEMMWMIVRCPS